MCGIGGILRTGGKPIPKPWLDAIDARIASRGPDGHGRFRDRVEIDTPQGKRIVEVALVHRRLSIIDPEGGAQPMVSKRGRKKSEGLVAVVFNGCIYNHRELRAQLKKKRRRFVTDHSDTEVLIHGHREWGDKLADHLEGMYAYAIWDHNAGTLTLARDVYGEKPIYCCQGVSGTDETRAFGFSSEPRGLRVLPTDAASPVDRDLQHWTQHYLQLGYVSLPHKCVPLPGGADAIEIGPGARGIWRGAHGSEFAEPNERVGCFSPIDDAEVEGLLETAVARRLEADVPLGCFLSGGVDSSLIAYFARKHKADLRTFSVKMPDPRYDESPYAERVAAHLGTDHTTLEAAVNPAQDLVQLIDILGQPFGDSSILPTYWVSKAAREHVKVALSGDGGDEMFVGYERYKAARYLARHWRVLSKIPAGLLGRAHPKSRLHKLGRLGEMARDFPKLGVLAMESIFTQDEIGQLTGEVPDKPIRCEAGDDAMAALRRADIGGYLPADLLRKVDTASMAVALEVRCPYLDRELTTALQAAPIEQLTPGGRRKGLLRWIAHQYLPAEAVDRPKMGFAIPLGQWFRNDFGGMRTLLLDHLRSVEPFGPIHLQRTAVRRFIDEHMSGKRDHSHRLFALLTLSIWAKSL